MNSSSAVSLAKVSKAFGTDRTRVDVLRGLDLDVQVGEFVAVMGPSGSGKSTLLHLIGGLEPPDSGAITVGGHDLSRLTDDELTVLRRQRMGFVFQYFNLVDVLTAVENVSLPMTMDGLPESQAKDRAVAALEVVGLADRHEHLPSELSGGEQQRVAIARALVTEPLLILADEPTGNLDSEHTDQIMRLLREIANHGQRTILMVTHDARCAAVADRIVRLADGAIATDQTLPPSPPPHEVLQDLEAEA